MGYQESWVRIQPQCKFKKLIHAYEKAEQAGYYNVSGVEPMSVVVLKQPFGELSAGTKLLWVCGDRGWHTVGGLYGGHFSSFGKVDFIPVERVLEPEDHRLDGIDLDSNVPTENEYMKRYSIANYAYKMRTGAVR